MDDEPARHDTSEPVKPLVRPGVLDGADTSLTDKARRGRRTTRGVLLRVAVYLVGMLGVGVAGWFTARNTPPRPTPAPVRSPPRPQPSDRAAAPPVSPTPSAPSPAVPSAIVSALEQSVVLIEYDGPGDLDQLGSGFVVDKRGWIATNFHVISPATQAHVRFQSGTRYEVAGYLAVHPQWDLAILQLRDPPQNLQPLPLRGERDPVPLAPIVAVGHPHGVEFSVFDGKVSRVVRTAELAGHARTFLAQLMSATVDHRWIQHTARISPGNSGGPLLSDDGHVLGINTWVDVQTGFGYALHAGHLEQLRARTAGTIEPLEKHARHEARLGAILKRLSAEHVRNQLERAESVAWSPADDNDYSALRELAWAITIAQLPGTLAGGQGLDRAKMDRLVAACDQVSAKLRGRDWNAPGQVTLVNELAMPYLTRPLSGVFFFGTVQRVVRGDAGERAALVEVAGTDRVVFLPLDGQLAEPKPGSQYLVLGVNYDGRVVRFGDNPLRLTAAPVIASRTLIPLSRPQ